MKYISVLLLLFLTSSCSTNYYLSVNDKNVAYVSFSNLSQEIPEISIISKCKQSQIDPKYIKFRKPGERSNMSLQIPSNQPVTFIYNYAWFEGEEMQLVTKGNQFYQRIEKNSMKDVKTCTEQVTFIPEPNRHYEVYFGKNIHSCVIKASEVFFEPETQKKHLMEVKLVVPPDC